MKAHLQVIFTLDELAAYLKVGKRTLYRLAALGEIVVWARPDEFPPRNMQTSKGLRALGYNVRIGV